MPPPTILIVGDDPGQRALFSLMLRHLPYSITTVGNAEDALHLIRAAPPALMILDVMMPWMDGLAMLHALRAEGHGKAMKVVLLTNMAARLNPEDAALADKVLAKPIVRDVLEREIWQILAL